MFLVDKFITYIGNIIMNKIYKGELENKIMAVVTKYLNIDIIINNNIAQFDKTTSFDNLTMLEIIMRLENKFNIEINDNDLSKLKNLDELINFIIKKVKKASNYY